jgi:hypothetical protein
MLNLLITLLLAATAPPTQAPPSFRCVLQLQGELNRQQSEGGGSVTIKESFEYSIPGTLTETTSPGGAVLFDFVADPKVGEKGKAHLRHRSSTLRGGSMEELNFEGNRFQAFGAIRFESAGRGQAIYPSGSFYVGGHARILEASPDKGTRQREEDRFILSQPFPDPGPTSRSRPAMAFTGSSLWVLRNSPLGSTLGGTMTYNGGEAGRSATGRVDIKFVLSK